MPTVKIYILLSFLLLCISSAAVSQTQKDTVHIFFDRLSDEQYNTYTPSGDYDSINKYRKRVNSDYIYFYIANELFTFNKNKKPDTLGTDYLNNIELVSIDYINNVRQKVKHIYFFKKDVFKKIYLLDKQEGIILRYEVSWASDLIIE